MEQYSSVQSNSSVRGGNFPSPPFYKNRRSACFSLRESSFPRGKADKAHAQYSRKAVQEQVSSGLAYWEKQGQPSSKLSRFRFSPFITSRTGGSWLPSFLFSPKRGPAGNFPCRTEFFMAKLSKNLHGMPKIGYTIIVRDCILELIINNPPLRLTKAGIDCKIVCCLAILFGRTASQRCFSHRCKR